MYVTCKVCADVEDKGKRERERQRDVESMKLIC